MIAEKSGKNFLLVMCFVHIACAKATVTNNSILQGATNQGNISFVQNFNSNDSDNGVGVKGDFKGGEKDSRKNGENSQIYYQGTSNTFNWGANASIHNSINNYLQNDSTGVSTKAQRILPPQQPSPPRHNPTVESSDGNKKRFNDKIESMSGEI